MATISPDELKEIIALVELVPAELKSKCFELLLTSKLTTPEKSVAPLAEIAAETKKGNPKQEFILPIDVKAFLSQYEISEASLGKSFFIEGTEIRPIYKLDTTKKAEAQIHHALMLCLENALNSSKFEVDVEVVRKRCEDSKCYDPANFASNFKNRADLFKGIKKGEPLALSPEGKSELAEILEATA